MGRNFASLILIATSFARADITLSLNPKRIATGQTALARVELGDGVAPADLSLHARDTAIPMWDCPDKKTSRCGLIGVPADEKPGSWEVSITWKDNGTERKKTASLAVRLAQFIETKLSVDPDRVHPSEEDQKRIDLEKKEIEAAYATASPIPRWLEKFEFPLQAAITSRFGNRRSFNGELKSIHQGVDLRAATGTPIVAVNAGRVALAKELFFAGNMVLIDHGGGVFSSYAHLSSIKVAPGQDVKRGELVGLAGKTGRVTGPHLHWGVRVHGTSVDPHQARASLNRMWLPNKPKQD